MKPNHPSIFIRWTSNMPKILKNIPWSKIFSANLTKLVKISLLCTLYFFCKSPLDFQQAFLTCNFSSWKLWLKVCETHNNDLSFYLKEHGMLSIINKSKFPISFSFQVIGLWVQKMVKIWVDMVINIVIISKPRQTKHIVLDNWL